MGGVQIPVPATSFTVREGNQRQTERARDRHFHHKTVTSSH